MRAAAFIAFAITAGCDDSRVSQDTELDHSDKVQMERREPQIRPNQNAPAIGGNEPAGANPTSPYVQPGSDNAGQGVNQGSGAANVRSAPGQAPGWRDELGAQASGTTGGASSGAGGAASGDAPGTGGTSSGGAASGGAAQGGQSQGGTQLPED